MTWATGRKRYFSCPVSTQKLQVKGQPREASMPRQPHTCCCVKSMRSYRYGWMAVDTQRGQVVAPLELALLEVLDERGDVGLGLAGDDGVEVLLHVVGEVARVAPARHRLHAALAEQRGEHLGVLVVRVQVREEDEIPVPVQGDVHLLLVEELDLGVRRAEPGDELRHGGLHDGRLFDALPGRVGVRGNDGDAHNGGEIVPHCCIKDSFRAPPHTRKGRALHHARECRGARRRCSPSRARKVSSPGRSGG